MKNTVKVLMMLVLLGGLVCNSASLAQAAYVRLEALLIDVKVGPGGNDYTLYLKNHAAVIVPSHRVTIKYLPHRVSVEPQVVLKGRKAHVKCYNGYDEATFIFRDHEEYLKYLGNIKKTRVVCKGSDLLHGGCFIATAAYGTPVHEDLDVLRDFRDNVLKKNWLGQRFVDWYYANGPTMANWVSKSETRKSLVRNLFIKPAVFVLKNIEEKK